MKPQDPTIPPSRLRFFVCEGVDLGKGSMAGPFSHEIGVWETGNASASGAPLDGTKLNSEIDIKILFSKVDSP